MTTGQGPAPLAAESTYTNAERRRVLAGRHSRTPVQRDGAHAMRSGCRAGTTSTECR